MECRGAGTLEELAQPHLQQQQRQAQQKQREEVRYEKRATAPLVAQHLVCEGTRVKDEPLRQTLHGVAPHSALWPLAHVRRVVQEAQETPRFKGRTGKRQRLPSPTADPMAANRKGTRPAQRSRCRKPRGPLSSFENAHA